MDVVKEAPVDVSTSVSAISSIYELEDGEKFLHCIQCGTCGGVCPFGPWMDFVPRRMISAIRWGEFEQVLESETAWMCVSCHACTKFCPQQLPLSDSLMARVKEELLLSGNVPEELQLALENSQRYGNPMGESPRKRGEWAKDLKPPVPILGKEKSEVEVLWYVGDYPSYHPRSQETAIALAKVLRALGIDFAILGPDEVSDGDSQRMAGERGLFEYLAEKNAKAFDKYAFHMILTTDPHAYNAIKNQYPTLGFDYHIQHFTEFLVERVEELKPLLTNEISARVTYHDPCYLGRVNDIYDPPRRLIEAIPGVELIEMSHNRTNSLCCGGGGGGMWLDGFQWEIAQNRLSDWRTREAVLARPVEDFMSVIQSIDEKKHSKKKKEEEAPELKILAVACPYEKPRFEDATKTVEGAENILVKDISELLAESMGVL
jgi:Fe-S oxidoreductase